VGNKNGSLFEASRRWIKDGAVLRVKKGPKLKPGWMHLFNDILILSAPKGRKKDKKFHWRAQVSIESLQMDKVFFFVLSITSIPPKLTATPRWLRLAK